ncbi:DUF4231 domain-containing protein [Streptomyces mirabilis]|uniref:DUF4231 domain-containing protein n=1 Tax=Streptomyces mirabilis TaxID=68239 RepID=UPI0033A61D59
MSGTDDGQSLEAHPAASRPVAAAQDYVEGRLSQYQKWYDKKAVTTKAMHLRMRTISVVGGALVPVLLTFSKGCRCQWGGGGSPVPVRQPSMSRGLRWM